MVRCWAPADAPLLKAAIDASLEHLRPWMPWARDHPQPAETQVALLRHFRGEFDLDQNYVYGILSRDEAEVVGGSGLHPRLGVGGLEIGYWIRADRVRQGLATETAGALTRVAFEVNGMERVEIHCDARNAASAAVARKLGYALVETRAEDGLEGREATLIWRLVAAHYAASPAARLTLAAYHARSARLF
ncbi:MAG: GNAT family N-acetyltransferase [Chloroflexota bacterium]